jgi:hypothetical protein
MIKIIIEEEEKTIKDTTVAIALIRKILENINLNIFTTKQNPANIEIYIREIINKTTINKKGDI